MKNRFEKALKTYEERFGLEKTQAVQMRLAELKAKVIEENEAVLEWLPAHKRSITMETLLQKTYQTLIEEMEEELNKL